MNKVLNKKYCLAVPTYKRYDVLQQLLATIPRSVTVCVSDNGATLPDSFQQEYPHVTVNKVIPSVPMFPNWNKAVELAQSEWVVIPSDDDVYYPESFAIIERYLEQYSSADMIVFGHNTIDADGNVLGTWLPELETYLPPSGFSKFKYGVDARMPSIFVKTKLFKELGGFDEGFRITAADSDFIQRAALMGNVQFVPEVVSGYRVWEGGTTYQVIATLEWMDEIDRWCDRIINLCEEQKIDLNTKNIKDEIYARNLLAGIAFAKKAGGYSLAWEHVRKCRYPVRALFRTQVGLIYRFIKP